MKQVVKKPSDLLITRKCYQNLIFRHVRIPLSSVPFHKDIAFIERFFCNEFPMHLAIHKVTDAERMPDDYTQPHVHDVHEINILVGNEGELDYAIQLGEEIFHVQSNASIWIPAGLQHASNAIRGSGYFIAIQLNDTSLALKTLANVQNDRKVG